MFIPFVGKCNSLKQYEFIIHQILVEVKSPITVTGCHEGWFILETVRENLFACFLQPLGVPCIPSLLAPCLQPSNLLLPGHIALYWLWASCLSLIRSLLIDCIGLTWTIQYPLSLPIMPVLLKIFFVCFKTHMVDLNFAHYEYEMQKWCYFL